MSSPFLVYPLAAPGAVLETAAPSAVRGAASGTGNTRPEAGQKRYARRAGIAGSISQSVRSFGARRNRYRGLPKTHLQQVMTAVAINVRRLAAWFAKMPKATTRTSHFAALAA